MRGKSNERRHWALGALGITAGLAAVVAPSLSGCNDHVFDIIEQDCVRTLEQDLVLAEDVPADILLVIDNSGSMCEEQDNLAANFFNPVGCPITDLNNVPPQYKNPDNTTVAGELAECGFIQLLAAYDNEFRVGIITTDVGPCDNRYFNAENPAALPIICAGENFPDWGRRPQRGCLQAPPGAERKYIQKGDDNIGERFNETIANIQTFGSGFERGLDAMEVFLDPSSTRAEGCSDDRNAFIRNNAKLIVIFLSDEQDCSHADGQYGFVDENAEDVCDADIAETYPQLRETPVDPGECYSEPDKLGPVNRYVDFLKNLKGPGREDLVSSAVIAGAVFNEDGNIVPAGCTIQNDGNPDGNCRESRGSSFLNGPGETCDPANGGACCDADSGSRYFDFANQLGNSLTDSICYSSFRQTMVKIAQFIAAKDTVLLGEAPANERDIQVYLCANGEDDLDACDVAARIPNDVVDTTGQNGWQLVGDRTVTLFGTAIPQPGELVKVFALAQREAESGVCASATE